jgi:hypothetical protein
MPVSQLPVAGLQVWGGLHTTPAQGSCWAWQVFATQKGVAPPHCGSLQHWAHCIPWVVEQQCGPTALPVQLESPVHWPGTAQVFCGVQTWSDAGHWFDWRHSTQVPFAGLQ